MSLSFVKYPRYLNIKHKSDKEMKSSALNDTKSFCTYTKKRCGIIVHPSNIAAKMYTFENKS